MAFPSLSWGQYIAIVLLYWVLVVGGWMFYTTRPSTQRRAREQCVIADRKDTLTGVEAPVPASCTNLPASRGSRLGPPRALLILWLAARRRLDPPRCPPTNAFNLRGVR